jgi:hypothetical protein
MRDTIDMAREVKATAYTNRHYPDRTTYTFGPEQLKAFEALVRADERDKWMERAHIMILGEREACAKVCEDNATDLSEGDWDSACINCADHIRDRGNT